MNTFVQNFKKLRGITELFNYLSYIEFSCAIESFMAVIFFFNFTALKESINKSSIQTFMQLMDNQT